MRRSPLFAVAGVLILVIGLAVWSAVAGNSVQLGLDLEGGTEVVLEPVPDTELEGAALEDALDQSVEIIRSRVDGIGAREPDISRQSNRVIVQLAGVADQQQALELVGDTAELRFRPVCSTGLPADPAAATGGGVSTDPDDLDGDGARDRPFGLTLADADPEPITDPSDPGNGGVLRPNEALITGPGVGCENIDIARAFSTETTSREDNEPELPVILPDTQFGGLSRVLLGRTMLTGTALESADASFAGVSWLVRPTFKSGAEGIDLFNNAAAQCFTVVNGGSSAVCPSGQLGMVLDLEIISAPNVNTPFFERDRVEITGSFTQSEAETLALQLNYGALPIEFGDPTDPESGSRVRLVSATLGKDSLDAGVVAGIVGLVLVALYMIAYYRLLGVAAMLSLAVSGTILWVILAYLSEGGNLVLTLAGVVGLIVSIGTSLDSNVVYFEHLKEDIGNGRTLRSSVDRSFPVAFKTMFWANLASLIGAAILYWLTIGSVKGFALMLGLASVLDLFATYFFLRPFVKLVAGSSSLSERPALFGMPEPGSRAQGVGS